MKIAEGLRIIQNGWIRKPKGFRVRFYQQTATGLEAVYSPPLEDAPLNSDVTAWRYAWKLWQATRAEAQAGLPGALYNIVVVDDLDHPVRFYGTSELDTYNPYPTHKNSHHKARAGHYNLMQCLYLAHGSDYKQTRCCGKENKRG